MQKLLILTTIFIFAITTSILAQDSDKKQNSPIDGADFSIGQEIKQQLTDNWIGVFSNEKPISKADLSEEEAKNPMYRPQNIIVHSIFTDSDNQSEQWYYIGWYMVGMLDNPLDQALLKVYTVGNQTKVDMYAVPNAHQYKKEWQKDIPFETLKKDDILDMKVTTLHTALMANDGVRLYTSPQNPFPKEGVNMPYSYVDFDMSFYPKHITSNTRFLDANKKPLQIDALNLPLEKVKNKPQKLK